MFDAVQAKQVWTVDIASRITRVEFAFAPDRHGLAAVASGSDRVRILDAESGRLKCDIVDAKASLSMPALSADGRRLAAWCSGTQRIRIFDIERSELIKTASPQCMVSGLCLAPDGKTVAAISAVPLLIPIESEENPRYLNSVFGGMSGRFSPDGSTLAVASRAMAVQLLDVKSASSLPASPRDVLTPWPVEFTENGDRLLVEGFQSWTVIRSRRDQSQCFIWVWHETMLFSASDRAAVSPDRSLIARCTAGRKDKSN